MSSANVPADDVLGYEIVRCTISGGQIERAPVGFATGGSFADTVSSMNNRAVFYEVTLVDKYPNRSAAAVTSTVKIEHDGSLDKSDWTVGVTGLTADAASEDRDEWLPCEPTKENPAEKVIDSDQGTVYEPTMSGASGEILLEFNRTLTVSGLKYTAGDGTPIGDYEIQVCQDGQWIPVAQGTFDGSGIVCFANADKAYVSTYAASVVKLTIQGESGAKLSIAELDVPINPNPSKPPENPRDEEEDERFGDLRETLNNAQSYPANSYAKESYAALKTAMEEADVVMKRPDATDDEIEAALLKLQNAIGSLVPVNSSGDGGSDGGAGSGDNGTSGTSGVSGTNGGSGANGASGSGSGNSAKASANKTASSARTGDSGPIFLLTAMLLAAAAVLTAYFIRKFIGKKNRA